MYNGLLSVGALEEEIRVIYNTGSSDGCPTTVAWDDSSATFFYCEIQSRTYVAHGSACSDQDRSCPDMLSPGFVERHPGVVNTTPTKDFFGRGGVLRGVVPHCSHHSFFSPLMCHSTIIPTHTRWLNCPQNRVIACSSLALFYLSSLRR